VNLGVAKDLGAGGCLFSDKVGYGGSSFLVENEENSYQLQTCKQAPQI